MESKAQLLEKMDAARNDLWRELQAIDDSDEITPGMTKRKVYVHIAGWESLVFAALRQHILGIPADSRPYPGVDALNAEFFTVRQGATTASAKLECDANRFAIRTLLDRVPETDFETPVRFIWGEETFTKHIHGAIDHEREHADEVAAFRQRSAPQA